KCRKHKNKRRQHNSQLASFPPTNHLSQPSVGPPGGNSLPPTFPPQLTSLQSVVPPQRPSLPPNIFPFCQISQNSSSLTLLPLSTPAGSPSSSTPSTRSNIEVSVLASSSINRTTAPACSKT
ncbi:hypothetical protein H5410_003827, partial [Solanum commersonii]